ncbi:unnamed protein product [Effrenium voratum]|nr:unnamed protein product [Effrenium voratum]
MDKLPFTLQLPLGDKETSASNADEKLHFPMFIALGKTTEQCGVQHVLKGEKRRGVRHLLTARQTQPVDVWAVWADGHAGGKAPYTQHLSADQNYFLDFLEVTLGSSPAAAERLDCVHCKSAKSDLEFFLSAAPCAVCGVDRIVGPRFRCIHCPSFSVCPDAQRESGEWICQKCEPKLEHAEGHVFEIMFEDDLDWEKVDVQLPKGIRARLRKRAQSKEFAKWWEDEDQGELRSGCFHDALRRELARRLELSNFRQLQLAKGEKVLGPDSPWSSKEEAQGPDTLVAIVRPYLAADDPRHSLLFQSAKSGDLEKLVRLLEEPCDPNAVKTSTDSLALHEAAEQGHAEVARVLLEAGANKNREDCNGGTALHDAAWNGHHEVVQLLVEKRANLDKLNFTRGDSPLHCAAYKGYSKVVHLLLQGKADTGKNNFLGEAPLHSAAIRNQHEIVRQLVEGGADKDKANGRGETPLHLAIGQRLPDPVRALLKARADQETYGSK